MHNPINSAHLCCPSRILEYRQAWRGRWLAGLAAAASVWGLAGPAFDSRAEIALEQQASAAPAAPRPAASTLSSISLEDLMNVQVTTVSREESTVGESPAAVFVVTQDMIHRSGATSIPEILRMVPGVNVARLSSNQWVISIRGFDNTLANKLLVQVDGRTVYSPVQSGVFWDTVDYPLEDIERIEVVRGPGGTVWGANAVNGIINIITKPAKDTQGLLISSGGGSEERGFTTVRFGGQIGDNLHYRVYGKWFERGAGFNSAGLAHDDWRSGRAGFRLEWTPERSDTVTLQGDWFSTMSGQSALPPAQPGDLESRGVNVLGRWTHVLGKDSNWQLQAYYDRFDQRAHSGADQFTVDTLDIDFQQQFPLGDRQKLIYGLGYRMQDILFSGAVATFPKVVDVQRNVFSAFLQDEIKIVENRLFLTLGSKFEHNEFTGFELQPSARLLWTPTKRQSLWASVSRAVRTPDILENDFEIDAASHPLIIPNRDLRSEEVVAYELGYRAQATEKLSFDTALFYNKYDRLSVISAAVAGSTLPLEFTNGMNGETYGVEISATWNPIAWWKLHGAYSYLKLNLHADQKLGAGLAASDETVEKQSPQNHFYLRSSFDLPGNVQFDLTGRYVDSLSSFTTDIPGLPASVTGGVKSYFTLDARLAWKACKNLEFAVVGQNLLDNHHPEVGVTSTGLRIEVARSVYGMVTIQW